MKSRALPALVLAGALVLTSAPAAFAHAQLLGSSPQSGATVAKQPAEVIFEFNQAVGGTLGAVRVYNAQGKEVDNLYASHPDGRQHWMGVGLKQGLPDGTYTATYRVISADTHIVYGGLVFNIGHAGVVPRFTVAGLIGRNQSGEVTKLAFGAVQALDYVSLALGIGGLAFLVLAWLPALAASAGAEDGWEEASRAFARRMELLFLLAVALGIAVGVLGLLLQGASAAGVSLWASLKGTIVGDTLKSRFGEVWGVRALVWAMLGVLLLVARRSRRGAIPVLAAVPAIAGAASGGESVASVVSLHRRRARAWVCTAALGACFLAITPALSGHPSTQGPRGVFFPADVLHVLGASVWVGGIACLLFALPAATRRLEGPQRTRLLLATLARFSPWALACVVAIALTGVVQAYIDVRSFHGLLHTTYGVLVLVKVALLLVLIGLGWVYRERVIPALKRLASAARASGRAGILARRTMRGELALMLAVFGVTAALVSYAPPIDAASGPFSTTTTLGPAEVEMTVEPARVGLNTVHIYLIDAKTGSQFTATKEFTVTAKLPGKGIGPLPLKANLAGPGHYVLSSAELSPGGHVAAARHRSCVRIRRVLAHDRGPHQMTDPRCIDSETTRFRDRLTRSKRSHPDDPNPGGHMRPRTIAALLATATLAAPAAAQAHISLHPNTIPAGAFVTLDVRVPGEQEGAYAYKIDMLVPPGFTQIDTQNVPGWSVHEIVTKPTRPIQTDEGPVDEEVSQIVWTGDRSKLGRLENGTFIQLPLSIAMPSDLAGHSLAFKTVQYYSNGKVVHWIGAPSAEFPAPTVNITAKGGVIEDVAGGEAGPTPGETSSASSGAAAPASAGSAGGASKGLAITALVVGALGLIAGIGGLLMMRRERRTRSAA